MGLNSWGMYPVVQNKKVVFQTKEEIKEVLDFTNELFNRVCGILEIDKSELIQ